MSKMGKWLLIFGIVALAGAVLFGISVAAFGVKDNNYGISIGDKDVSIFNLGGTTMNFLPGNSGIHFREDVTNIDFDFEANKDYDKSFDASGLKDIQIALASCNADITCTSGSTASLTYRTGSAKVYFSAELRDGVLQITEKPASVFNIGSFKSSSLTLSLPEKLYESLKLELASGSIKTSGLTADSLKAQAASGSMELGIFADSIDLDIASGKMTVTNCTDKTANNIDIDAASGSIVLNGFGADSTKVNLASGNVTLNDISGSVNVELASGKVNLNYAQWNGSLGIDLMSGKVDAALPEGSGAAVEFEKASGSINIALDGESVSLSKGGNATIGGSNVQNVKAHTMSGSISIHN